jgi:hypothetical protein
VETGGSPILSYRLDWDDGTDMIIWPTLVGEDTPYLGTTWTQSVNVPGKYYNFRLSLQNAQGWSDYSPVASIQAAFVPEKVGIPIV